METYLDVTLPKSVAGKASGGSATVALGCLLHSLANEAISGSILQMTGCVLLLLAGKASGKLWWREARPVAVAVASPWWRGACCFSWSVRQVSGKLW